MTSSRFGLIGHGAVGSLFARLLKQHGASVVSYDIQLQTDATAEPMRRRILNDGAEVADLEQVLAHSDFVLSVTPTQSCVDAARRASRLLGRGQFYCDLASAPPAMKRQIADEISATGAEFIEGVILGTVGASDACPAILLGGSHAESAALTLQKFGLRARFYSSEIGRASAFKMIRSVFSKGMETLLIETLVAARCSGILEEIWREVTSTLAKQGVEHQLETWIRSHAVSSERRYFEMREVTAFLEDLGVEPVLTRAITEVFRRSNDSAIADRFPNEPERIEEVIEFLAGGR
jgi:3-hydroxyisobutyrate dehydrogenase-like beta-hydroxyacid dehydrogenase